MKKLAITALLAAFMVFGFGEAAHAARKPKPATPHSTITAATMKRVTPKYSTKGSGFHHIKKPNYYHQYWTGGKKNRQTGK